MASALISAADLAHRIQSGEPLKLLDGTFYLPNEGKDAKALFAQAHIAGAKFFDIDAVCTPSDLPHTAPTPEIFSASVGALGISERDLVVVYDQKNLFSAPRVWWTFRMFGHDNVLVLNGGLPAWIAAGGETVAVTSTVQAVTYTPRGDFRSKFLADKADVQSALDAGKPVADARPAGRFTGADKEPRAGMRSGHMPGATNVPLSTLVAHNGEMVAKSEIHTAFEHIDPESPIITTCGSGVTAAGLSLSLHEIGLNSRVYDGSWSEWGRETSDGAVVTGES